MRYNITSRTFDTFVLPEQLSLPVGLAVDNNGNLWATDHGTSIFYMLDTKSHNVTMFATSNASPKIYGLNESSSLPEDAYTLPYWMQKGADDGSIWFNEHQGNKNNNEYNIIMDVFGVVKQYSKDSKVSNLSYQDIREE